MDKQGCVNFIRSCTDEKCQITDNRVQKLFDGYDDDEDGKVTEEEFLEFYKDSSNKRPETVRANIMSLNYTNDLKKISEYSAQNVD